MTADQTLSSKQRKALEALLLTGEVTHAATAAHVTRDTVYRWLKQPVFAGAVREAEAQALDEVSRVLIRPSRSAVATLAAAMADKEGPGGRHRAQSSAAAAGAGDARAAGHGPRGQCRAGAVSRWPDWRSGSHRWRR